MNEAVDNLHAIEGLVALANSGPGAGWSTLQEAHVALARMGFGSSAFGYKAEKLKAVSDGFDALFGSPPATAEEVAAVSRNRLIRDIDLLRKALARGAEGQD